MVLVYRKTMPGRTLCRQDGQNTRETPDISLAQSGQDSDALRQQGAERSSRFLKRSEAQNSGVDEHEQQKKLRVMRLG